MKMSKPVNTRAFASLKIIVFICFHESENVRNSVLLSIIWYGLIIKSNCYSKPFQALYYVTPVNLFDEHLEHNTNDYSDYSSDTATARARQVYYKNNKCLFDFHYS